MPGLEIPALVNFYCIEVLTSIPLYFKIGKNAKTKGVIRMLEKNHTEFKEQYEIIITAVAADKQKDDRQIFVNLYQIAEGLKDDYEKVSNYGKITIKSAYYEMYFELYRMLLENHAVRKTLKANRK